MDMATLKFYACTPLRPAGMPDRGHGPLRVRDGLHLYLSRHKELGQLFISI